MVAKTITFAHYKGGTGKTTSCINIAGFLANSGYRVLAVDLDPQGNLTSGLGVDKKTIQYSMYHVMKKNADIRHAISKTLTNGIHVVPANIDLVNATLRAYKSRDDTKILKKALEVVKDYYDFILIDTPPSNGHFIINGAVASDFMILVLDPGIFALEGVESFKNILEEYSQKSKLNVTIGMALVTKCKNSFFSVFAKDYSGEISEQVSEILGKNVFMIPYSYHIIESQIKGMPISHTIPYSSAGRAYSNVAQEILNIFEREIKK